MAYNTMHWGGRDFYEIEFLVIPQCDESTVSSLTKLFEDHPDLDVNERADYYNPNWRNGEHQNRYIVHLYEFATVSSLIGAAYAQCPKTARFLLEHGADVNTPGHIFKPIIAAAFRGISYELTELLVSYGADVHCCDKYGNTALHYAVVDDKDPRIMIHLLEHGADPHAKNIKNQTPISLCHDPERQKFFELVSSTKSARR